ncbi:MAG: hypothetical protein WEC59_09765 [Salibacteraceae bacterium]
MIKKGLYLLLIMLWGCEKDPVITPDQISPNNYAAYLATCDTTRVVNDGFVVAGNHWSFERTTSGLDQHFIVYYPEGASNLQLFTTQKDSNSYRDSAEAFLLRSSINTERINHRFARIARKNQKHGFFYRVSFWYNDSLHVSPVNRVDQSISKTETISSKEISVAKANNGFLTFTWTPVPGADRFWIELTDHHGDVFMSLINTKREFQFYDLRNTVRDFTPELRSPELIEGNEYTFSLKAINQRGWMLALGKVTFSAP